MSGTDCAAQLEATVFLEDVPDHRQRKKVLYPLDEVFFLSLMAVLAGAEGFTDIARFGAKKLDLLRRFRPFVHGTPSHDQLGDIFAALDGKISRRSGRKGAKDAIHTVSAFAARQNLVLAQRAVAEKSNEIVATPALLDLLSLEGTVVTTAICFYLESKAAGFAFEPLGERQRTCLNIKAKCFIGDAQRMPWAVSAASRRRSSARKRTAFSD